MRIMLKNKATYFDTNENVLLCVIFKDLFVVSKSSAEIPESLNQGTQGYRLTKKTKSRKSPETVPLRHFRRPWVV
jgi:hypothetical protein